MYGRLRLPSSGCTNEPAVPVRTWGTLSRNHKSRRHQESMCLVWHLRRSMKLQFAFVSASLVETRFFQPLVEANWVRCVFGVWSSKKVRHLVRKCWGVRSGLQSNSTTPHGLWGCNQDADNRIRCSGDALGHSYASAWHRKQSQFFSPVLTGLVVLLQLTAVFMFAFAARQIQRASSLRTDVRPAVVRPAGGLWKREEPGALHTQHSARLFLFL